ncbi:unnamed protein product [Amoebophrya sp. A120]|nr:unnamed protein product [Amoebophrya sp. A120]|eukprot:GSA120T00011029001.1
MERWASSDKYFQTAYFVCVCVQYDRRHPHGLPMQMGAETRFQHAINGYCNAESALPRYGQLGCQGFVMFDRNLEMKHAETSSFLQVKQLAFENVEQLLDSMIQRDAIPPFLCPGEMCVIQKLENRKDLNGRNVICLQSADDNTYVVTPGGGKQLRLKAENLRNVTRTTVQPSCAMNSSNGVKECNGCDDGSRTSRGQEGEVPSCTPSAPKPAAQTGAVPSCIDGACPKPPVSSSQQQNAGAPVVSAHAGYPTQDKSAIEAEQAWARCKNLLNTQEKHHLGIEEMDEQHEQCFGTLKQLVKKKTADALLAVEQSFRAHFEDEEATWKKYGFGNGKEKFSATKSHIEEHERVLLELVNYYKILKTEEGTGTAGITTVAACFTEQLLKEFFSHIEDYDSKYEQAIKEAMADEKYCCTEASA